MFPSAGPRVALVVSPRLHSSHAICPGWGEAGGSQSMALRKALKDLCLGHCAGRAECSLLSWLSEDAAAGFVPSGGTLYHGHPLGQLPSA